VHPVPRPVSLKEGSIRVIREFIPEAEFGPLWPKTPKGLMSHVRAPQDSVRRMHETALPAWIVFPKYERGAECELTPVSKARALFRTAENAFNYSVLGAGGFETLTALIDRCDCYEFVYSDLSEALETFHRFCGSPALVL
jgi:HprK-related kinase A